MASINFVIYILVFLNLLNESQATCGPKECGWDCEKKAVRSGKAVTKNAPLETCGYMMRQEKRVRVLNGDDAHVGQIPWQAKLLIHGKDGNSHCGATIISDFHLITAAHCIGKNPCDKPKSITVYIGGKFANGTEQKQYTIKPENIFVHEAWDITKITEGNDIAILKTNKKMKLVRDARFYGVYRTAAKSAFKKGIAVPACLPASKTDLDVCPDTNVNGMMSGYGRTADDEGRAPILQWAKVDVHPHDLCNYWWGGQVSKNSTCADGYNSEDQLVNACSGDSGGPLSVTKGEKGAWYLYGVASFVSADGCSVPETPAVYTRVDAHLAWIIDMTGIKVAPAKPVEKACVGSISDTRIKNNDGEEIVPIKDLARQFVYSKEEDQRELKSDAEVILNSTFTMNGVFVGRDLVLIQNKHAVNFDNVLVKSVKRKYKAHGVRPMTYQNWSADDKSMIVMCPKNKNDRCVASAKTKFLLLKTEKAFTGREVQPIKLPSLKMAKNVKHGAWRTHNNVKCYLQGHVTQNNEHTPLEIVIKQNEKMDGRRYADASEKAANGSMVTIKKDAFVYCRRKGGYLTLVGTAVTDGIQDMPRTQAPTNIPINMILPMYKYQKTTRKIIDLPLHFKNCKGAITKGICKPVAKPFNRLSKD